MQWIKPFLLKYLNIYVLKHQRNGECSYLLCFENQVSGDILQFVNSQLVPASTPTLPIDLPALYQPSNFIAHLHCISSFQYKWSSRSQWIIDGADFGQHYPICQVPSIESGVGINNNISLYPTACPMPFQLAYLQVNLNPL